MKKLLKKMAYDREKHEKQEKAANDVRKSWRPFVTGIEVISLDGFLPFKGPW